MIFPDRLDTATASPVSSLVEPPVSPALSVADGDATPQHRRRRRLAKRRAYNRSHRRHRSSRNLFISYAADDNLDYPVDDSSMSVPSVSTLHNSGKLGHNRLDCNINSNMIYQPTPASLSSTSISSVTTTPMKQNIAHAQDENMNSTGKAGNVQTTANDIEHPYQFSYYTESDHDQPQRFNRKQLSTNQAANESGCEFVSEPEPEHESSLSLVVDRFAHRPLSARRSQLKSPSNESPSFFLSNPFAQFKNNNNNNSNAIPGSQKKQQKQQLPKNSRLGNHQSSHLLHELNSSGSLDSTTASRTSVQANNNDNLLISSVKQDHRSSGSSSKRYQLVPTQSSHVLPGAFLRSPTNSSTNASNSKTNTNFFSSLLGSRRRLEMSTSSNELVLPLQNAISNSSAISSSVSLFNKKSNSNQQINCSSALGSDSALARGSSPAVLDKTKRLSKSSMRIELPPTISGNNQQSKQSRYSFLTPTIGGNSKASSQVKQPQQKLSFAATDDVINKNTSPTVPRTNCSIDYLCRAISLDSPPSSSYVLSELAISQLACIDNVHFSDLFHGSVNESASSINLQQSVSTDPRLYQDDIDIKFSRTLNSCRLPQIRYATKERLFERLTDLRFLSIDFLNTFLLTYRVFASGEEVLEALKNVHYNYDDYITRGQRSQQERIAAKLQEAEMKQHQQDLEDITLTSQKHQHQLIDDQRLVSDAFSKQTSPRTTTSHQNQHFYPAQDQSPTTFLATKRSNPSGQGPLNNHASTGDNEHIQKLTSSATSSFKTYDSSGAGLRTTTTTGNQVKPPNIPSRTNIQFNQSQACPGGQPNPPAHPNQLLLPSQLSIQKRRSTINALSPITGSTSSSLINLASQSRQTSRETNEFKSGADTPTITGSPLASSNEHIADVDQDVQDIDLNNRACNRAGSLIIHGQNDRSELGSCRSENPLDNEHQQSVSGVQENARLLSAPMMDRARSSSVSNQAGEYRGHLTLDIPNNRPVASRQNRAQSISCVTQNLKHQPCEHWRITFRKHIAREEAAQAAAIEREKQQLHMQDQNNHHCIDHQHLQQSQHHPKTSQSSENGSSFKLKLDLVAPQSNHQTGNNLQQSNSSSEQTDQLSLADCHQPAVPPTTPISGHMPASFKIDGETDPNQVDRQPSATTKNRPSITSASSSNSSDETSLDEDSSSNGLHDGGRKSTKGRGERHLIAPASPLSTSSTSGNEDDNDRAVFLRVGDKLGKNNSKSKQHQHEQIVENQNRRHKISRQMSEKSNYNQLDSKLRHMSLVKEIDLVSGPTFDSSGDDAVLARKLARGDSSASSDSSTMGGSISDHEVEVETGQQHDRIDKSGSDCNKTNAAHYHKRLGSTGEPPMSDDYHLSNGIICDNSIHAKIDVRVECVKEENSKRQQPEPEMKRNGRDTISKTGCSTINTADNSTIAVKPKLPARSNINLAQDGDFIQNKASTTSTNDIGKTSSGLLGAAINSMQQKLRRCSVSAHFSPDTSTKESTSSTKPHATQSGIATAPATSTNQVGATATSGSSGPARVTSNGIPNQNGRSYTPRSSCQPMTSDQIDFSNIQSNITTSPVSRAGVVVSSRSPRLSTRRSSNASALSAFAVATAACDNSMLTHAPGSQQIAAQASSVCSSCSPMKSSSIVSPAAYRATNIDQSPNNNSNMPTYPASVSNSRASSRLSSSAGLESGANFYSSASINQSQLSLLHGQQQQHQAVHHGARHSLVSNSPAGGSILMNSPASGGVNFSQSSVAAARKRKSAIGSQGPVKSARSVATLRVLSVLRHWISKHSQDFVNDPNLSAMTQEFLRDLIDDPRLLSTEHKSAIQLHQMVERASQSRDQQIDLNLLLASPTSPTKESIETLSALEIAEGMTFLDHKIFLAIRSEEFLSQAWMKPDKAIRAPHILLMTKRFNDVSRLVSSEIIRVQEMHRRVAVIEKWTNVAHICRVVHNFNGVLQICAAFTNSAVFRLKKTWDKISKTTRTTIDQLQTLVSTDSRFRNMRDAINRCDPPSIPYVGMYLTDLSFIEEGTPNFAPDGLLNFSKMRMIAHVIREIQHLQKGIYKIDIGPKVANYLLDSSRHLTDDQMYRSSLAIEARSASSAASHAMQQHQQQQQQLQQSQQSSSSSINVALQTNDAGKINGVPSNQSLGISNNPQTNNTKGTSSSPARNSGKL